MNADQRSTPPAGLDWNDLQALLALVRGGSLRRASALYGQSPATLSRKVEQLEAAVGALLVERLPSGSRLTAAGQRVFEHAQAIERLAGEIGRVRDLGEAGAAQGTVRINADEWISFLLTRHVHVLRDRYPGHVVEVLTSHRARSLSRGEVDIAVRPFRPAGSDLVGRSVGTLTFGLYASASYARENAGTLARGAWGALQYVGFDELHADFEAERWLRAWAEPAIPWLRCSYALGIYDGILAGAGLGVLAQFITQGDQRLVAVRSDIPELRQRYWMAFHRSTRRSARIRAVADFIVQAFTSL